MWLSRHPACSIAARGSWPVYQFELKVSSQQMDAPMSEWFRSVPMWMDGAAHAAKVGTTGRRPLTCPLGLSSSVVPTGNNGIANPLL